MTCNDQRCNDFLATFYKFSHIGTCGKYGSIVANEDNRCTTRKAGSGPSSMLVKEPPRACKEINGRCADGGVIGLRVQGSALGPGEPW